MKSVQFAVAVGLALAAPISANATTLSFTVTADNAYSIYVSTNVGLLGDLVGTSLGGPAGQWSTSTTYSYALNSINALYFVHVVGTNYNSANGLYNSPGTPDGQLPNPNAFLGQFSVDSGYTFSNGLTAINTNSIAGQWYGTPAPDNTSWTTPANAVQSYGVNGSSSIWGTVGGISTSAEWIWSNPDNASYADLSTQLTLTNPALATPLPGALPLFASGLGAFGMLVGRRRKRVKAAGRVA